MNDDAIIQIIKTRNPQALAVKSIGVGVYLIELAQGKIFFINFNRSIKSAIFTTDEWELCFNAYIVMRLDSNAVVVLDLSTMCLAKCKFKCI